MEYTEADYLVAKLKGELTCNVMRDDSVWFTSSYLYTPSQVTQLRGRAGVADVKVVTFEEWKARMEGKKQ